MLPRVFLSHRMDALVDRLLTQIDAEPLPPMLLRTIVVPHSQMKQWLLLEIAKRKGIAMGLKVVTIEEGIEPKHSPIEMFCRLYDAVRACSDPEVQGYLDGKKGRLLSLTGELSSLFRTYERYGEALFDGEPVDWQHALLQKLCVKSSWRMADPLICFGIDELPPLFWDFLFRSSSLSIYLFSPCAHFWQDIRSERERRGLNRYWKKRKASEASRKQLDAYLRDAPPLLANWGRLGRETLGVFDRCDLQMEEAYPPLEPDSVLKQLQSDLLYFTSQPKTVDDSVAIFLTGSSRLKEVECLRDEILRLQVPFHEISVLAPNIEPYVPLIEFVFRNIPYRISGFDIALQSSFRQGLMRIFQLVTGRWEAEDALTLFETPSFYRKQGWDGEQLNTFRKWIEYARIRWGLDASHKKQILAETLGKETDDAGSWEKGLDRLLDTIVYLLPTYIPPDALEAFIEMILRLKSLPVHGEKTLAAWADQLEQIANEFLQVDLEDEADGATYTCFTQLLRDLRESQIESLFPFAVIQRLLNRPSWGQIHASHLHAVRFAPLEEGALFPAKALFLIGMDEESFPRRKIASSLDLLKRQKAPVPELADRDRYLFLQALFSAQEFLRISYGHLSADEGKPVGPSLVVQELMQAAGLSGSVYRSAPAALSQKASFAWPRFSPAATPEGEKVISLADLRQLARHPWKFYLQKAHGMYLNEPLEASFAMQKGQLLRAALENSVVEADLPPGLLGEAIRLEVEEKKQEWQGQLADWQLEPFSLILRENCTEKQWEGRHCIAPPIEVRGDGWKARLVGEVKLASRQGLICSNEDSVSGLLKAWPDALAVALTFGAPQIWMLKSGKSKAIESVESGLQSFLSYYFHSLASPSPLLADWADALLRKGPEELRKKMEKEALFEDPVMEWVLARVELPPPETIVAEWGPLLKETFAQIAALYPSRRTHAPV